MITVISLSSKMEDFKKNFKNSKGVEQVIDFAECTDYRIMNNQEVLIYNGRQILYSCCLNEYKNKKYITHIYNREAKLVYEYHIDYNL